jgi:hypothetical protein
VIEVPIFALDPAPYQALGDRLRELGLAALGVRVDAVCHEALEVRRDGVVVPGYEVRAGDGLPGWLDGELACEGRGARRRLRCCEVLGDAPRQTAG